MSPATETNTTKLARLYSEVLELALKARAGSTTRRNLALVAADYPHFRDENAPPGYDITGGMSRDDISDMITRVNKARLQAGSIEEDRGLRRLRNNLEDALDLFDRATP